MKITDTILKLGDDIMKCSHSLYFYKDADSATDLYVLTLREECVKFVKNNNEYYIIEKIRLDDLNNVLSTLKKLQQKINSDKEYSIYFLLFNSQQEPIMRNEIVISKLEFSCVDNFQGYFELSYDMGENNTASVFVKMKISHIKEEIINTYKLLENK